MGISQINKNNMEDSITYRRTLDDLTLRVRPENVHANKFFHGKVMQPDDYPKTFPPNTPSLNSLSPNDTFAQFMILLV